MLLVHIGVMTLPAIAKGSWDTNIHMLNQNYEAKPELMIVVES